MVYDCLTLPHTPVVHQKCSPYKMAHFLGISPILRHPKRDGSKPLGVTKRGGVDHVLTQAYLHFRSYPHSILLNISMNISMGWYIQVYTYIYNIDVFIELYCDISDIPLKYVFFSIFLHETQRQTCNVPGSVVSLIHTMDTSVTWIGDPPAIFLGDQPGGKQHYVYISVIQSL